MSYYECTFILRPDMPKNDVQKLTDSFEKIIKDHKGKIVNSEYWGLRTLAYKINKNAKGHYGYMAVDAPYEAVEEMGRQMRLNEDVIRNLTVKLDGPAKGPTVVMKHKSSDDADEEAA